DDDEKPRFAGLRPGQKMDTLTLEEALELFKLPRTLGTTAEGEPIVANIGRFGPYLKYGNKYVSLKEDDPYTITLDRALEVIRLKQEADAARIIKVFEDEGLQVLNGRYGPYVTDGKKNAKIPKDRDPKTLTLEECRELIAQAPERGAPFGRRRARQAAAPAGDGQAAAPAASASTTRATAAASAHTGRARPATAPTPRGTASARVAAASKAPAAARTQRKARKKAAKKASPRQVAARKLRPSTETAQRRAQRAK